MMLVLCCGTLHFDLSDPVLHGKHHAHVKKRPEVSRTNPRRNSWAAMPCIAGTVMLNASYSVTASRPNEETSVRS